MKNTLLMVLKSLLLLLVILTQLLWMTSPAMAADNVEFSGTLRAQACTLHPDDATLAVDMQSVGLRDLYLGKPSAENGFAVRLTNCNLQVARDAVMAFTGRASSEISGALLPDVGSQVSGVALVLKDAQKQVVTLNANPVNYPLNGQNTTILFYGQLQAEPTAISAKTIVPGSYSATVTFTITYP